jgi:hypothetical protein|nr:MAG TPA: hypothetical protein [Caudoviricetes sp.]
MIEMTAHLRFESEEIELEDLLAFTEQARAHTAAIGLDYAADGLTITGLYAYWEVTGDGAQQ